MSAATQQFFHRLREHATSLQKDCGELRSCVDKPPLSNSQGSCFTRLTREMTENAQNIASELNNLSACCTDGLSMETLLTQTLALYQNNQEWIETVETQLEKYGYVRPDPSLYAIESSTMSQADAEMGEAAGDAMVEMDLSTPAIPTMPSAEAATRLPDAMAATIPASPAMPTTLRLSDPKTPSLEDFGLSADTMSMLAQMGGGSGTPAAAEQVVEDAPASPAIPEVPAMPVEDAAPSSPAFTASAKTLNFNSPAVATPPRVSSLAPATPEATPVAAAPAAPVGLSLPTPAATPISRGGGLDATIKEMSEGEFGALPDYLRAQVTLADLNACGRGINAFMATARGEGVNFFTQENFFEKILAEGEVFKGKAIILALKRMNRITTEARNLTTVYYVV